MSPERWRRIEAVLDRVLEVPGPSRAAALEEACAGDTELRREVEALLTAEAEAPAFLEQEAARFAAPALAAEEDTGIALPAKRLGSYRLIREIGAGGMSRVYLAEREGGEFDQQVAIKILRAVGLDLVEGAIRFRAERQILASFDHPSIARVFDGGTTEAGMPYLVMELIDGVPITEHAVGLGLEDRLRLFIGVCDAVEYAHRRLTVHRDLKPSNILVTSEGQLKLLDFGIAKLLDPAMLGLDEMAPVTRTGLLLMTPEYAAPEQVRGQEVTTSTDVYALGVLLYEMLTGRRPFRLAGKSASQVENAVCHEEPTKPSTATAVGDSSAARHDRRRLVGDLDTIVLKALRKEPGERYESVRALADDVGRYLDGLPIAARPATAGYRVRKFAGRHRWGVAAGLAALLALVAFGAMMAWQQSVTRRERDRALSAEAQASAINRFLVEEMLGAAAPEVAQGRDVGVLDATAQRIEGSFSDQPILEAPVRRTLGELYLSLGEIDEASKHLERAHQLLSSERGPEHPESLVAARLLGEVALARGQYDRAAREIGEVVEGQRSQLGSDHPDVWKSEGVLARIELEEGDYGAARLRLERLLTSTPGDQPTAEARIELESILMEVFSRQRRWLDVEATAARILPLQRERLGPSHPAVARTLSTLGFAQSRGNRSAAAQESLEEALAIRQRILGEEHPDTLESLRSLAAHHGRTEDFATARRYAERNAALAHRMYGPDHPWTIRADEYVGVLHSRAGGAGAAEPYFRDAARRHEAALGPSHPSTIRSLKNWNGALLRLGRIDEARQVARRVLAAGRARVATGDEDATFLSDFAFFLVTCRPEDLREPEEALPLVERAVELTDGKWDDAFDTLARVRFELGEVDAAIELQRQVLSFPSAVTIASKERQLVEYLEAKGDLEQVEVDLRLHFERRRAARGPDDPSLGITYRLLGLNFQKRGLLDEARIELEKAVEQFTKTLPSSDFQLLRARSELGEVLLQLRRFTDAESHLVPAAEGLRGRTGGFQDETTRIRSQERVAELYEAWGKADLAAAWAQRAKKTPRPGSS